MEKSENKSNHDQIEKKNKILLQIRKISGELIPHTREVKKVEATFYANSSLKKSSLKSH